MYIGAAVTAFRGWDALQPADRAKLVLGAVQQAIYTLKSGGEAFKAVLEFRADKARFLAAAAAEAVSLFFFFVSRSQLTLAHTIASQYVDRMDGKLHYDPRLALMRRRRLRQRTRE